MENSKNRIVYADILRIIATFAVVILHVAATKWHQAPVQEFNWQVFNVYDSLVRWAVPIFVMLSGMMFLNPEKEILVKNIFCKYIFRIIIVIVFWGLFYQFSAIFAKRILQHELVYMNRVIVSFGKIIFGPPWYHLWYLYMLVGLYILTPLYRIFTKNAYEKEIRYLLIMFFIFGLCLPFVKKILLYFDARLNINFELSEFINYSGYFFAGYYFSKYSISKKMRVIIYIGGIISFIFTIIGSSYISIKNNEANGYLYGNLLPTTMFEAYMIFICIKRFEKKKNSEKKRAIVSELSKCSFGIYLIHDFVKQIVFQIGLTSDFIIPLLAVPIVSIIIFAISFVLIYICRKIPISKYIM